MEIEAGFTDVRTVRNDQNKKVKQSVHRYLNSHFPCNNIELFDSEKEQLTTQLENEIIQMFEKRDTVSIVQNLGKKRSKLQLLYGIATPIKQTLSEMALHLALEEQYMRLDQRLLAFSFQSTSTLEWKPLWNVVLNYFKNDPANTSLKEILLPEQLSYLWALKRIRNHFEDSSIGEIYDLYKKMRMSGCPLLSLILLRYFLKISPKTPKELYSQIFQELAQQLNYDQPIRNKLTIMTILSSLQAAHPELEWEDQYEQIFTYFSRFYLQRVPLGFSFSQPQQKTYYLSLANPFQLIQRFLINLIVPETEEKKHGKIWQSIQRFFNLFKQYLHPNYENTQTVKFLLQQFQQFVSKYIASHASQQKTITQLEKTKIKLSLIIKLITAEGQAASLKDSRQEEESELSDSNVDTELLKEDDNNINMDKAMDAIKQQAIDYDPSGGAHPQNSQNKAEDEDEDADDEDEEEDVEDYDETFKKQFQEKSLAQQLETIEKLKNKLEAVASKLELKKRFAFDKACHAQFEDIVEQNLVNIIYLNDSANLLTEICKDLCYFNPEKFIPLILDILFEAFEKPDLNFSTTINILTSILLPMVDRNNYRKGLYQIPALMRKVIEIFNSGNFSLTLKMWRFFDQIFQIVPIYDVDDLLQAYLLKNPAKNSSDFYTELNKGEEIDMRSFYEQLSSATLSAFQKFLSIFEHIDMPRSKSTRGFRAAVLSVLNYFTSIAFSSSKSLFTQLWDHAFSCITDRQQNNASKFYSYLIHAFALRDPQLVLSKMIPYLSQQILTPRDPSELEAFQKQPLFYLIEAQPNKEDISKVKIECINTNSIFWYLNLLEDSIYFGKDQILHFKKEIEAIIFQCFVHQETELCKKACQLLQKLFHSLITFYPSEMFIWSDNEIEDDPDFKEMYHRYIGQNPKKKFSMKWHEPSSQETEYAKELFFKIYNPILAHYQQSHFNDLPIIDYFKQYEETLDSALSAPDDASRGVKIEHQRSIMVLFHLYSSIATRLKQGISEKDKVYHNFCKSFCLPEYCNVNKEMIKFCGNLLKCLFKQNLFYDSNIAQVYLSLILFILGNDDQTNYINGIKSKLKDIKTFNANPYRSYQAYPRFVEVTSVTTQFNTKIILYGFDTKLDDAHQNLLFPLLFLIMHPTKKISDKSVNMLMLVAEMLETESSYNDILLTYCSFLKSKLSKDSSNFLPKKIEELKEQDSKNVPMLSTYLQRIMASINICNLAINKFSSKNSFLLDTLLSIIESYNAFSQKEQKDNIIDLPLTQIFHIVTKLKKWEVALKTPFKPLGIYKEKSSILQALLSKETIKRDFQMEDGELQNLVKDTLELVYNRCLVNLNNPATFSKEKVFMLLMAMKTADFSNINDSRFQKVLEHSLILSNQDNLHSRNIGRAILFKCIRSIKSHYKTRTEKIIIEDSYISNQNKTLEDFFRYYLYSPEDIEKGFSTNRHQEYIIYQKTSQYKENKQDNQIYLALKNEEYLTNFLDHLLNDITAHSHTESQLSRPKNIFNNSEMILQCEFIRNCKKNNLLVERNSSFQIKLVKKLFSIIGFKFFEVAKVHLEKHKDNKSTIEGSLILNTLLFGCLLGLFSNEIDINKEERNEIFNYLIEILRERMYELNREQFAHFINIFESFIESISLFDAQQIFKVVFECPKLNNRLDQKYYRLLYTKILSLTRFNLGNQEILQELLTEMKTIDPLSIQQLPVYYLVHNAIWSYHQIPIDLEFCKKYQIIKDLEDLLMKGKLKKMDKFQAIRSNNDIREIYQFVVSQLNSDDLEVKKKYYRITKMFSSIFKEDHLFKTEIFDSMSDLYPYLIQFKEEDVVDQQLIQELWQNLVSLSIPLYNKETVIAILQLCYSNFKNANWRVRQRALLFNQYLAFFNLYRIEDYNYIDPLLEMMNDDQKQNKSIAQKVLSSMIKTLPPEQVGGFVEKMQKMAITEDKNQKIIGVYCLMSVLLSYPHDIKEWTENAIRTILKNKKITPDTITLLKEFGAAFLRNAYHNKMESKLKLPEDLIMCLEEISRPHNYFA